MGWVGWVGYPPAPGTLEHRLLVGRRSTLLFREATYLPIKIGVSLTAGPKSGKDSEPGVVKVQPWRLSPPLAFDSSYR